ncbi:ATP-binding cassette domain-containing protein [Kitasatospora sp. NPDC058965]|uniref:ATP-binding cassette domain-containing protein n=1 Tax=Kitasatospora sp. NPDC058965 TaxID=3346682 RepID=UPI0036AA2850
MPDDRSAEPDDPLFGGGLAFSHPALRHDLAHLDLGILAIAAHIPRLVTVAWRQAASVDPRALFVSAASQILVGLCTAFGLLTTTRVLTPLFATGPTPDRLVQALPALAAALGAMGATRVLDAVSHAANGRLAPKVQHSSQARLMELGARVELATAESADFHNLMASAQQGNAALGAVIDASVGLLNSLVGIVAAAGVLGLLKPQLLPLLLLSVVPNVWSSVRSARARFTSLKRHIELTRQMDLLAHMVVDNQAADEVRAHAVGGYLTGNYRRLAARADREQARLAAAESRVTLTSAALSGTVNLLVYLVLGLMIVHGAVPLALAGTALMALTTVRSKLAMMVDQLNHIYNQGLFVLDWEKACHRAAAQAMRSGDTPVPDPPTTITARNLRFRYPGSDACAVDGVDLELRKGEVVALVGHNGSGKTTLAKLLAGLYTPLDGTLRWDGAETRGLSRDDMLQHVAILSQTFAEWPFTARANITIGDHRRTGSPALLARAAQQGTAAGVIDKLAHGWDTLLAREFWGGTNLSGGEWQRIGLSRIAYRDAAVLVFDEPTAALDPQTEIDVFNRVVELADQGRIVILVTHRIASVRKADRVYVMDSGKVVESGTHDTLLSLGGRYAHLHRLQAAEFAPSPSPTPS